MALEPKGRAPYTSASAAITALSAFRDRAPSGPVTTDMLFKLGVPESITRRTLNSMQELELIGEDGRPTEILEAFKQTRGEDEYQALLQKWIRDVYADVLPYGNPSEDSIETIQEAFRGYEPEGQRKAMASLLIGLWEYAGLSVPEQSSTPTPRRSTPRPKKPASTPRTSRQSSRRSAASNGDADDLPPGLVGMLRELPAQWTEDRRKAFLNAFTAMLDFTVPVVADTADQDEVSEVSHEQEDSP